MMAPVDRPVLPLEVGEHSHFHGACNSCGPSDGEEPAAVECGPNHFVWGNSDVSGGAETDSSSEDVSLHSRAKTNFRCCLALEKKHLKQIRKYELTNI